MKKISVIPGDGIGPEVIKAAEKLRADYSVAILHKAKKMGPMFDMLEKQGYTKFAQFKDGELTIK